MTIQLPEGQPAMRLLARPKDTNSIGDIFGGWIMSQVDLAGSVAACKRAKGRTVTVAVNSFHFKKPVCVGDVVSCYASVKEVGNTSITVFVEVYAERDPTKPEIIKVTEATLTYVAIDELGNPKQVDS
jgi:acyl-CoA thioesterase YciA